MRCPDAGQLARAASVADDVVAAHALDCPRCGAAIDAARALVALARAMPAPALTAARRRQLADAVQVAADVRDDARRDDVAHARPRRARYLLASVLALAAGGVAWSFVHGPDRSPAVAPRPAAPTPAPPSPATPESPPPDLPLVAASGAGAVRSPAPVGARASVVGVAGADFERVEAADEDRLLLRRGLIRVDGGDTPARAVRIVTAGAELRGQGARFEARGDRRGLRVVRVFAGTVEITEGARRVVVSPGETWTWEAPPAAAPVVAAAAPAEAPRITHFQQGWTALRAGDFAAAATALDAARDERGVEEDAAYWAAVAWARAGDTTRARRRFEEFLVRFAASPRAGEAHLALARLLHDAGERAAADVHVDAASRDQDARVRAAAEALRTR